MLNEPGLDWAEPAMDPDVAWPLSSQWFLEKSSLYFRGSRWSPQDNGHTLLLAWRILNIYINSQKIVDFCIFLKQGTWPLDPTSA